MHCVRTITVAITLWGAIQAVESSVRVAFLPFESRVKLNNSWDLAVDVPRWFSRTIDTVGVNKTAVSVIPFDSVLAAIRQIGLNRSEYLTSRGISRLSSALGAEVLITGTVTRFRITKQAINTDAPFGSATEFNERTFGQGGVTIMGGLQSYEADIGIELDFLGSEPTRLSLDTRERDAGVKLWLRVQLDNPEMNFYYTGVNPFGSEYFRKSVAGVVMIRFSERIKEQLLVRAVSIPALSIPAHDAVEGRILEREGNEVYIDIGSADRILKGEHLDVFRPDRPVLNAQGDTLGWVEKPAGSIRVRLVKAVRFSVAVIEKEIESIQVGWIVRARESAGSGEER